MADEPHASNPRVDPTGPSAPGDPYSRTDYRRLIAWGPRIEREAPFLRQLVDGAPDRSVLDVGCGTGEHTAFFASQGCRAVGIDASESMLDAARDHERDEGADTHDPRSVHAPRFVLGDARDAASLLQGEPPFGAAICLGNMLPHVIEDADLDALLQSVRALLLPGGRFLVQLLNYARLLDGDVRHLPVNFRPGESPSEEIVFLRLLAPAENGRVLFFPTTLVLDRDAEEPVRVEGTRRVELRAWRQEQLGSALERAGFAPTWYGDMHGGAFDPGASHDLVFVARAT